MGETIRYIDEVAREGDTRVHGACVSGEIIEEYLS